MRILTSSYTMDWAGVPTYTMTLERELKKHGHEVTVFSPKGGPVGHLMTTVSRATDADCPDVIIAQHNKCAYMLRDAWPRVPFVFAAHGVLPELEQPPRGITVDRWTAIHQQVKDNLIRQYVPGEQIDIVRDFVDTDTFRPLRSLRAATEKPRVLFISNYKKWKAYYRLSSACRDLGLEFKAIGSPYRRSRDIVQDINDADIVVSWARGILEAMACGRTVVSFDGGGIAQPLGDGYITEDNYYESRERNFSGYECQHALTVDGLKDELRRYDPRDGERNRHLIDSYHSAPRGAELVLRNARMAIETCQGRAV